jgi:hypothetical protein
MIIPWVLYLNHIRCTIVVEKSYASLYLQLARTYVAVDSGDGRCVTWPNKRVRIKVAGGGRGVSEKKEGPPPFRLRLY